MSRHSTFTTTHPATRLEQARSANLSTGMQRPNPQKPHGKIDACNVSRTNDTRTHESSSGKVISFSSPWLLPTASDSHINDPSAYRSRGGLLTSVPSFRFLVPFHHFSFSTSEASRAFCLFLGDAIFLSKRGAGRVFVLPVIRTGLMRLMSFSSSTCSARQASVGANSTSNAVMLVMEKKTEEEKEERRRN